MTQVKDWKYRNGWGYSKGWNINCGCVCGVWVIYMYHQGLGVLSLIGSKVFGWESLFRWEDSLCLKYGRWLGVWSLVGSIVSGLGGIVGLFFQ